jgi:hypothetical protein
MQKAYLLICLAMWCQFDSVLLASCPPAQSAPLADEDDDEYLSVKSNQTLKKSSSRQKAVPVGLKPKAADLVLSARRDVRRASKVGCPDGPSFLYVLMSLQR